MWLARQSSERSIISEISLSYDRIPGIICNECGRTWARFERIYKSPPDKLLRLIRGIKGPQDKNMHLKFKEVANELSFDPLFPGAMLGRAHILKLHRNSKKTVLWHAGIPFIDRIEAERMSQACDTKLEFIACDGEYDVLELVPFKIKLNLDKIQCESCGYQVRKTNLIDIKDLIESALSSHWIVQSPGSLWFSEKARCFAIDAKWMNIDFQKPKFD